jgi:F-type H+-transporting ATPase subunit gamma
MADLKTLKLRIGSIKKTQKITKAMKMVAASKLRRAREAAENARLYSDNLAKIIAKQANKKILLLLNSSDRGLCGGLNTNLVKFTLAKKREYEQQGLEVKIWLIGKKANDQLKYICPELIIKNQLGFSAKSVAYKDAVDISSEIISLFNQEEIDLCKIIYPFFKSAIAQEPKELGLIPAEIAEDDAVDSLEYDYEPDKEQLLQDIVPKNISIQLFQAFLEGYASEQGSRMTAMDNAVNNCADLIKRLNLQYNRTRQAKITTELVEIISAAESI